MRGIFVTWRSQHLNCARVFDYFFCLVAKYERRFIAVSLTDLVAVDAALARGSSLIAADTALPTAQTTATKASHGYESNSWRISRNMYHGC